MPAHDATTPSTEVSSGTTQTISHTTGSLTNGFVRVVVTWDTSTGNTVSATYNGNSLTPLTKSDTPFGSKSVQMFVGVNPASGAHDAVVTSSGTIVTQNAFVQTYSGVDQGTPNGTVANNNGFASDPITVSPDSTSDGLVVDGVYSQTSVTVGAGQAQRSNDEETWVTAGSEQAGTGSPVVMSWDGNTAGLWATTAVNLNASAAGAPTPKAPPTMTFKRGKRPNKLRRAA